jgi:hypothetical protein
VRATFDRYRDPAALDMLKEPVRPVHSFNPLVQIEEEVPQETHS